MEEKEFLKSQWIQLLFAAGIILLSLLLKPGNSQDDRVTIFGYKTPVLCLHRLLFNRNCAGCGLTRSFVSFAHGDIEGSYKFHKLGIPLFILVFLQIPIRAYLLKTGSAGYTNFVKKLICYPAVAAAIALIVNWFIFMWETNINTA